MSRRSTVSTESSGLIATFLLRFPSIISVVITSTKSLPLNLLRFLRHTDGPAASRTGILVTYATPGFAALRGAHGRAPLRGFC